MLNANNILASVLEKTEMRGIPLVVYENPIGSQILEDLDWQLKILVSNNVPK